MSEAITLQRAFVLGALAMQQSAWAACCNATEILEEDFMLIRLTLTGASY